MRHMMSERRLRKSLRLGTSYAPITIAAISISSFGGGLSLDPGLAEIDGDGVSSATAADARFAADIPYAIAQQDASQSNEREASSLSR